MSLSFTIWSQSRPECLWPSVPSPSLLPVCRRENVDSTAGNLIIQRWLPDQSQTDDSWPPESPRNTSGLWHSCQGVFSGPIHMAMADHLNYVNLNIKYLPFKHSLLQYNRGKGWNENREMALVLKGQPLWGWVSLLLSGPQEGQWNHLGAVRALISHSPHSPRFLLSRQQSTFFSYPNSSGKCCKRLFFHNLLISGHSSFFFQSFENFLLCEIFLIAQYFY